MSEHEPEARGLPLPGEVWGLWEMYQLQASKLFPLIISLRQQGIEKHSDEDMDRPLDDDLRPGAQAYLEETLRNCTALRARIAGRAARDLFNGLQSPLFTYREWNDGLREIYNTLEREIEDVSLFVPKSEYAGLLDDATPPIRG